MTPFSRTWVGLRHDERAGVCAMASMNICHARVGKDKPVIRVTVRSPDAVYLLCASCAIESGDLPARPDMMREFVSL